MKKLLRVRKCAIMFYKFIHTLLLSILMPHEPEFPPTGPKSPLAAAVLEAKAPARKGLPGRTPHRQNFEHSLMESIRTMGNRSAIGTRLDSIERITRPNDEYVLSHLCSVLDSRIAPLGEDAAFLFLDAVWAVSLRAKMEFGESDRTADSVMVAAGKLGLIAANMPDAEAFCSVCRGTEKIRDFGVLSGYIDHMLALSGELKGGQNPEGRLKDTGTIAFQASFIAERSDGSNHASIGEMLTLFSCIRPALDSNVAPLGRGIALPFLDAVWSIYMRAKAEPGGPEKALDPAKAAADKLASIAANVSNARIFSLVCRGMENISDFRVLSKYINYMLALSSHVRSERNPEGPIRDLQMPGFHATFIMERSDGKNHAYVDALLSKLLEKLNDTILARQDGPPKESP